ncbi:MAG TPA: hypothetical protein VMP01_25560 [Pirellulaceae bacterium]|nr:hypothetical protein [Pirellulaceae bacterium]
MMKASRNSWRFQFTLRTVFLLLTLFCVWLGYRTDRAQRQARAVAAIRDLGGRVTYRYQGEHGNYVLLKYHAQPEGPSSLRKLLGDDFFNEVGAVGLRGPGITHDVLRPLRDCRGLEQLVLGNSVPEEYTRITDEGMQTITSLRGLRTLWIIGDSSITDGGFVRLKDLTAMDHLNLDGTQISDAGLEAIATLPNLRRLSLCNTPVTDRGLAALMASRQLQELFLQRTGITDDGIAHLHVLGSLREVSLRGTSVTRGGIERLQQALPRCEIDH